ncbi:MULTISPECIES: hypothetical protein [unclassified Aureispira]|uniref:hypothetical protein n=1 Tax=unclassified Aureispira TaxID=2649989 RepID=UPI000696CD58|nr:MULTISPECIES: hypothetical protein [unclassified Aureispira]WMX14063.1 hypothetical protein QP953_24730 [Aureispira sp. CCB-E]
MRIVFLLLSFSILVGCGFVPKSSLKKQKEITPTVFESAYYQDLGRNIKRLHHLMQGTFIAHKEGHSKNLESWTVSEGDSVILYSVPLGEVEKHGYWLYSYEFMTSLPNKPIYTSIKQIKQISRDTLEVLYYETKEPVEITLNEVLNKELLNGRIYLDNLILRDKKVVYVRKSASQFVGFSKVYEDEQFNCLRQNKYDLSPNYYKVETAFFDKENQEELLLKKRPNLLVRRAIDSKILNEIAKK